MKVIKGSEKIENQRVNVLIYGSDGVGKTSTAFTANNPILMNFDKGVHRSGFRGDSIKPTTWDEAMAYVADANNFVNYDTIIVDTVGSCLSMLQSHLIARDKKLLNINGGFTQSGYGALGSNHKVFLNYLKGLNKDLVILAHDIGKILKNDDVAISPDITGGSLKEIRQSMDFVGYQFVGNNRKRYLNFNTSSLLVAKTCAKFETLEIPDFDEHPDWFARMISIMRNSLGQVSKHNEEVINIVDGFRKQIQKAEEVSELNALLIDINKLEKVAQIQTKHVLHEKIKDMGAVYDKDSSEFRMAA